MLHHSALAALGAVLVVVVPPTAPSSVWTAIWGRRNSSVVQRVVDRHVAMATLQQERY